MTTRLCSCPHGHPLCACNEGLSGHALWRRSNWLSSLAGWPGRLDPAAVAEHLAAVEAARTRPIPSPAQSVNGADVPDDVRQAVETCPHRKLPECGCSGYDCTRDGRRVGLADCLKCQGMAMN